MGELEQSHCYEVWTRSMDSLENLITNFISYREDGQRVALVTLIGNTGSSPRPLGTQMVVSEDGRSVGYLTGGCAESVIVSEAVAAIGAGHNRQIRLGVGSPYIDIQLPCGAGINLYIDVCLCDERVQQIESYLQSRSPVALDTSTTTGKHQVVLDPAQALATGMFRRWYLPRRRLLIMGKGPNTTALASLGTASDYEVEVLSPDRDTREACSREGIATGELTNLQATDFPSVDTYTAAVLLFHEHDWEASILKKLLASDCFYIGALGSQKTHKQRIVQLQSLGLGKVAGKIHGPVGMNIKAKTPIEIAISTLAEITLTYRSTESLSGQAAQSLISYSFASSPNTIDEQSDSARAPISYV